MTSKTKTHFRKVFKSDHLGQADLEEYIEQKVQLVFTIERVQQEIGVMVAGRKGNYNIAYFTDRTVKPLVLNATNSKVIKGFAGGSPFVEDWNNITVQLFIDKAVRMKGETVGGVRINKTQPRLLTEHDLSNYKKIMEETGANEQAMFNHLGITALDSSNYQRVMSALLIKQKQMESK